MVRNAVKAQITLKLVAFAIPNHPIDINAIAAIHAICMV